MATIPTLDARSSTLGDDILAAYESWGFGYIVGHPIDRELIAEVFEQSRRFHAMPLDDKMALAVDSTHRGFIPFKTSTDVTSSVEVVTKPNQSESLMIMHDLPADHPDVVAGVYLAGTNRWPELPGFREVMQAYDTAMSGFARSLMTTISTALGDHDTIVPTFDSPTTWLRLLHYPPQHPQSPDDEYGSAPHTDFGAITLLAQDDVGGLAVKTTDGQWVDVPPMPNAFVMNVGDMLSRWSNGRLLSTPHRVTNRSGRERYSVPYFFDPHVSTVIAPLPSLGESQFEPIVFGEFLRSQLEASYEAHQATPSSDSAST